MPRAFLRGRTTESLFELLRVTHCVRHITHPSVPDGPIFYFQTDACIVRGQNFGWFVPSQVTRVPAKAS
jgi:hypothetical protein